MNKVYHPAQKTIDITIMINGVIIGGQKNAVLNQTVEYVDVSNMILMEWRNYYPTIKSWNINCSGIVITDSENAQLLQQAYINNNIVTIQINNTNLSGRGTITQLSMISNYNSGYVYNLTIQGIGEINVEEEEV